MDLVWQWAWERYASRYAWAIAGITSLVLLPIYLFLSFVVLAFEGSGRYLEAAVLTIAAVMLQSSGIALAGNRGLRLAQAWSRGESVDPAQALAATYGFTRAAVVRSPVLGAVVTSSLLVAVGSIGGATASLLIQYGILGAVSGIVTVVIAIHSFPEAAVHPARAALARETMTADSLPRSRPRFATWANVSMISVAFMFAAGGAMLASITDVTREAPVLCLGVGFVLTVGIALPCTVGAGFSPSFSPLRDLARGTERVAAGDYSQRLPVVQDDDLGALAASFNRMQAGLAERQRLHVAFGSYVDPVLAARLLEQGDEIFTGERREVTVMFLDIRDFTAFAEARSPEDTVARLNELFEIVVPAVVGAGGHVNKFLGDGALAVFGAPNVLVQHADTALTVAAVIHRRVTEHFRGEVRIGIGINTGDVVAGTIGGGGHLEFTLIGDTTNVAARVEQLTKITGDAILVTEHTVRALAARPAGLTDRGAHLLKGKSASVRVFGLQSAVHHVH